MTGHEPVNLFLAYLGEDGTRAHRYWNFSGAWCCGEVAMIMKETTGNLFYDGKKVVYCPTAYAWCKTHLQKIPTRNAQYGDIIFYDWNKNGVPDHIGMVEYVEGTTVHALEGNTGSPARVRKRVRASYILGIFRPKYTPPKPEDYIVQADGEWGYHTTLGTQYVLNVTPLDGVLGKGTVKAIQKKVGTKADGGWGSATTLAMQKFLNANGITDKDNKKLVEDGEKGKATISAWQKWINSEIKKKIDPEPDPEPTPEGKGYDGTFPDVNMTYSVPKGQLISDKANEIAWSSDTAKANYKGGDSTSAFKKALDKAFPNRSSWGVAPRKGASCDVAVGTAVRASGIDTSYPRGLDEQKKHLPKSIFKKTKVTKVANLKEGDIFYYKNGKHTAIFSRGKTKEAGLKHYYMKTLSKAYDRLEKSGFYVWRASGTAIKTRAWLQKGDKNDNVRYLQRFLNWYGNYGLADDGDFGSATETAVKSFQSENGLTVDGQFGKACLAKAKEVKK